MKTELRLQQIEREQASKKKALNKFNNDLRQKELLANASNTEYAHCLKRHYLGEMIKAMTEQINHIRERGTQAGTERICILNKCLGVKFRRERTEEDQHKQLTSIDKHGIFDPELACHIALQLALDAALLPNTPKLNKKSTNPWRECKPTLRQIQAKIGEEIWRQLHYRVVSENFPIWFKRKLKDASNDEGSRSSAHYAHSDLDTWIDEFRKWWLSSGNKESAAYCEFGEWSYPEKVVIGSWLLSHVHVTGLFKKVKSAEYTREETLVLSPQGDVVRDKLIDAIETFIFEPLPMICQPLHMKQNQLGGWIQDGAVLNTPIQSGRKGWIELSQKHVDFYNHQQDVPFRVNQFVWSVINEMRERNLQLASWKFYEFEAPLPLWQYLEIPEYQWTHTDKAGRDALIHADAVKLKTAKRKRSKEIARRNARIKEGLTCERLFNIVEQCEDHDHIWIPIQPDFRSRYTCRTSFLSYQSTDSGRALLEFAEPHQIDPEDDDAKRHLSIQIANSIGLDKKSNMERIQWVESNLKDIEIVAKMDQEEYFNDGFKILQSFEKEDPFQFLAACREYYDLYITMNREYTHLPVAVDATCSGQQLIAGFLRDGELAQRVNVLPTTTPGDIYRDCMDTMLDLCVEDKKKTCKKMRKSTVKILNGSIGRKASKKGFMSGQYGSGRERQLEDIFAYLDDPDTDLKINDDERLLIRRYWCDALEKVCKIRVVFNWFEALAEEIYENGGDEVKIPTVTGSVIHQQYPVPRYEQIKTFHFGSSQYKESRTNVEIQTEKRNLGKWKTATAANCIHGAGDAALLCMALGEFDHSFYAVHDSISTYIGKPMSDLQKRLRHAYKNVVKFNLWDEIRVANGLPTGAKYRPALANTLDLDLVEKSEYMFC